MNIFQAAWANDAFRRVVLTGEEEQVLVMTIPAGGEIGEEVHPGTDQVLPFIDGHRATSFSSAHRNPLAVDQGQDR